MGELLAVARPVVAAAAEVLDHRRGFADERHVVAAYNALRSAVEDYDAFLDVLDARVDKDSGGAGPMDAGQGPKLADASAEAPTPPPSAGEGQRSAGICPTPAPSPRGAAEGEAPHKYCLHLWTGLDGQQVLPEDAIGGAL